ncbi:hypothetical protein LINPERHAP2_LOCUS15752 [Linum perenne]
MSVADLMIPGTMEWVEEHVEMLFNGRDATIILGTPFPTSPRSGKLIWHYGRLGVYTVRSAYRLYWERVVQRMHIAVDGCWTDL